MCKQDVLPAFKGGFLAARGFPTDRRKFAAFRRGFPWTTPGHQQNPAYRTLRNAGHRAGLVAESQLLKSSTKTCCIAGIRPLRRKLRRRCSHTFIETESSMSRIRL